jgi:DNA-directed RNA polymerase specialized sigma24 family protein
MQALGAAAAWQARCEYDPARGVPLDAFIHQRVMSCARTRCRQEWSYVLHCGCGVAAEDAENRSEDALPASPAQEALRGSLARLSEPDRWLIERLFWDGWTEARVAEKLGVSQPAVSKRKRAILLGLRDSIGCLQESREKSGL